MSTQATGVANSTGTERMSGPTKKGIRSLAYGFSVFTGFLTGGFSTLVGSVLLGATAAYSGIKSAIDFYKSRTEEFKEKAGSYFGRGATYLGRTFGTITVPWLQGLVSMLSGEERIRRNESHPYDYPDIKVFEAQRETTPPTPPEDGSED